MHMETAGKVERYLEASAGGYRRCYMCGYQIPACSRQDSGRLHLFRRLQGSLRDAIGVLE